MTMATTITAAFFIFEDLVLDAGSGYNKRARIMVAQF